MIIYVCMYTYIYTYYILYIHPYRCGKVTISKSFCSAFTNPPAPGLCESQGRSCSWEDLAMEGTVGPGGRIQLAIENHHFL